MGRMVFGTGKSERVVERPVAVTAQIEPETLEKPVFQVEEVVEFVRKPHFVVEERSEQVVKPKFEVKEHAQTVEKPVFVTKEVEIVVERQQIVDQVSVSLQKTDWVLRILLGVSAAVHIWSAFK